jgi:hypothetical protein
VRGGIDGDLRGLHLAEGSGGEAATAEDGFEEEGVVVSGGEEAGGGVAVVAADGCALREALRVTEGDVGARDGDVGGVGHAERSEDELLHDLVEGLAFDALDRALEVDVSFAGVAEAGAGGDADLQGLAVRAPVGESGAMAEDDACGDLREARVVGGVDGVGADFGPVAGERGVEVELALIDELEDGVGEDGF